MDVKLRRLKRLAEDDPSFWPIYARALEHAMGIAEFEPSGLIFAESSIVDAYLTHKDEALNIGGLHLTTCNDQDVAIMVEVEWEQSFGPDCVKDLTGFLSKEFKE